MYRLIVLLIPFTLMACAQLGGPIAQPYPTADQDTCNAQTHVRLIGQPATALEKVLILAPVRVIRPGQAVTMDYLENRINFHVSAGETVARISCG